MGRSRSSLVSIAQSREEEAFFIFRKYDRDNSGTIDATELLECFTELGFQGKGKHKTRDAMREWAAKELKRMDNDKDGLLTFDEFVGYYNKFIAGHVHCFDDHFEKGKLLGQGAFGKVSQARRLSDGAPFAVKQIRKGAVDTLLLQNEIRIWQRQHHPGLLCLIDVFEDADEILLVTELARGDLFIEIGRLEHFSETSAQGLAQQILSAVSYLHQHGFVHCDLKPSNILIVSAAPPLQVKIADFGLSQTLANGGAAKGGRSADAADAATGTKLEQVVGTPDYFAPELVELAQARTRDARVLGSNVGYSTAVDNWAIGCIIFELLAGRPPFRADSEDVLFYKITENMIEFPPEYFDEISGDVKELVLGLTRSDPKQRLTCAQALESPWLRKNVLGSSTLRSHRHRRASKELSSKELGTVLEPSEQLCEQARGLHLASDAPADAATDS